ncbi:amino-acid permease BAT1 homolog isoform X2 [Carex rostrata]
MVNSPASVLDYFSIVDCSYHCQGREAMELERHNGTMANSNDMVKITNLSSSIDADEARLRQLGYKQELKRGLSGLSNFAVSFALISVLMGITTTYNTGLRYGGPVSMTIGWLVVSFFTCCVASSMAEICSAYPTSGGLYYWSAKLAGKEWAPFASWFTGWFNIVGLFGGTTSVNFSLAQLIQVIILLSTGGANGGGYMASKYLVLGFHGLILISQGIINSLSIKYLAFFGYLGALWNFLGVFALMILIPTVATERASAKFVFTHFNTDNGDGIHSSVYIFVLGLLMSQYSLTGYDVSAHLVEETKKADQDGPKAIITSVGLAVVTGWMYLVAITFAATDIPYLLDTSNDAGGYAIAEIFYLTFKNRYGTGLGGIICLGFLSGAAYLCGVACVTSNSRMAYAFSRDGALPFSSLWYRVNREEVPVSAVWLSVLSLGSQVAFQAMVSIATIGQYIAYVTPIVFRVTLGRKSFVPGPFNLGKYSILIGWVAILWAVVITVLFSLPVAYPITKDTLNYAPVAVGGVLVLCISSWFWSARFWFQGPKTNVNVNV